MFCVSLPHVQRTSRQQKVSHEVIMGAFVLDDPGKNYSKHFHNVYLIDNLVLAS